MAGLPLSGVPLPTPIPMSSLTGGGGGKLSFLVSQQWDANVVSDNITGYHGGASFIWKVNRIFASGQR